MQEVSKSLLYVRITFSFNSDIFYSFVFDRNLNIKLTWRKQLVITVLSNKVRCVSILNGVVLLTLGLRGNITVTAKKKKTIFMNFFVKINSLYDYCIIIVFIYLKYIHSRSYYKNSLNNINISSLRAHWCTSSGKTWVHGRSCCVWTGALK